MKEHMTDTDIDVIIAGAGIVGLATAYQLQKRAPDLSICVVEKEEAPALHQTGRNSGVVHSGIYYKPGSLKAKNCLMGRQELLAFCDEHEIPYRSIHKLIVATHPAELPRLKDIQERGRAHAIFGLKRLHCSEVREIEPHVNALEALLIPQCQIIDYRQVALALADQFQKKGGQIRFQQQVLQIEKRETGCVIHTSKESLSCGFFVNCAGLHSDRLAKASLGKVEHQILPFRGEYYELSEEKKHLVNGLIYPVPDPEFPFLGVHLTPMMNGKVEAGPNAILAFAREGYRKTDWVTQDVRDYLGYKGFWKMAFRYWKAGCYEMARSLSKSLFLRDLRRLVPAIEANDLHPGGSGIRAQVVTQEGKLLDDFAFYEEKNILHVLNAPSPAATASFAIGQHLAQKVQESFHENCAYP